MALRLRNTWAASSPDKVETYQSITELLAASDRKVSRFHHRMSDSAWGGGSFAECVDYIKRGASPYECKPAIELLDKVNTQVHHRMRRQNVPSPSGAFAVVPEVLQGTPFPMRRRQYVEHDLAPLRIVVEPLVSAGVKPYELIRRGAAVAALTMALSEHRAVELWASWAMSIANARTNVIGRVKLDNNPLTVAEVVAVMASPQFARGFILPFGHAVCDVRYGAIGWAWNMQPGTQQRIKKVREMLGLEEQDIFIPGGFLSEADDFMRDPVGWVNSYVDAQRTLE